MERSARSCVRWLTCVSPVLAALALAGPSRAGVIASDDASDPAYADGWQGQNGAIEAETGSDNGGTGFLAWNFDDTTWDGDSSPYPQPHFIDTEPSASNGLGAPAFALTNANVAFEGFTTTATRPFAAALKAGDTLSFDVDNPVMQPLESGDDVGFIIKLQTSRTPTVNKNIERFSIYTTHGFNSNQWTIADSRDDDTSTKFSDQSGSKGFKFTFKLTGDEAYQLTITPKTGDALSFTGTLKNAGKGELKELQISMFGNGSGDGDQTASGEREFYFNHLTIESSASAQTIQRPADCNQDGKLNIADAISLIMVLFRPTEVTIPCEGNLQSPGALALLDSDGDGKVNLVDITYLLKYLFQGMAAPVLGENCQPITGCGDNSAKCSS
jgi:dockerin type I repeat protein